MAYTWQELPDFPFQHSWNNVRTAPIMHGNKEIIAISNTGNVCTFEIESQTWKKSVQIEGIRSDFCIAFDKQCNELYIIGGIDAIHILHMKEWEVQKHQLSVKIGIRPAIRFMNGELHIIGGFQNGNHFVWDDYKKTLKLLHCIQKSNRGLAGGSLIHIPSQDKLLLIGGYDYGDRTKTDTIRVYSTKDNEWKELLNENGDVIKLPLGLSGFGCILTRDERYIVIIGVTSGTTGGEEINIHHLDLRTLKWETSMVGCCSNFMTVL